MFTVQVNDKDYTNFTTASVNCSMDKFGRVFSLTATQAQLGIFPIVINDKIKFKIDGKSILTGTIEKISPSVDNTNHEIHISGRSIACDLVDSTVNKMILNAPISLIDIVKKVLAFLNLNLSITTNYTALELFSAADMVAAKPCQSAFEFIEQYARKRQVILLDDGDGNIVLAQASGISSPYPLSLGVNVLSSTPSYDYSERFNKYVVISQANPNGGQKPNNEILAISDLRERAKKLTELDEQTQTSEPITTQGIAIDPDIRSSRILYIKAENPSSTDACSKRAQWELNVRKARSRSYACVAQGHTHAKGVPIEYNTLHQVVDVTGSINDVLLISEVDYSESLSGTTTSIKMVNRDSYTLKNEKPVKQKKTSKLGSDFGANDEEEPIDNEAN